MNWFKNLMDQKTSPAKRASLTKKVSNAKKFHVRTSDKKVVVAHKSPSGKGYVYKSNGRNIHAQGNLYNTAEDAKKKVQRLKQQSK